MIIMAFKMTWSCKMADTKDHVQYMTVSKSYSCIGIRDTMLFEAANIMFK